MGLIKKKKNLKNNYIKDRIKQKEKTNYMASKETDHVNPDIY